MITKGKCEVWGNGDIVVSARSHVKGRGQVDICHAPIARNPMEAEENGDNLDLIAESFNVYNETGLTPRQLAEQRKDLLEACKGLKGALMRVLDKYDPDSIDYEWVGEAQEAIKKAEGKV